MTYSDTVTTIVFPVLMESHDTEDQACNQKYISGEGTFFFNPFRRFPSFPFPLSFPRLKVVLKSS